MSQHDPLVALRHRLDHAREAAELPWREAIGARNRLIHGYDFVDLDILWEIVATDLPLLVTQVEQVLEAESAR